jgi:predicted house-cleaning NTP pyrophosphatase (Maf/HAM1 superfamily)
LNRDNSGALEIQGGAAILCESINGDLQTVIGFPMAKFYQELGKIIQAIH